MIPSSYLNFDLFFTRVGNEYRVDVIEAVGGEAKSIFTLPFTLENGIWLDTVWVQSRHVKSKSIESVTQTQSIRDLGRQLYETVFRGDVSHVLAHSLEAAEQTDVGLRIRLRFSEEVADLALLPWETLFDPRHEQFIGLSERSPILRYLLLPRVKPTLLIKPPLRILTLLSNPSDTSALTIESEWETLNAALVDLQAADKLVLERLEKPTVEALHARLLGDDIHILHFVGHGTYDTAAQVGALLLEDESGNSVRMQAQELGLLLQNHRSLRLVYLNACEGALASNVNVFTGLAQTLVRYGVPAAVAMQAEITDQAAINLARTFYTTLAQGYPVDAALTQARVTLASQKNQEWVTPVLFSRSPDNRLFDMRDVLPRPDCPYPGMVPFQEEQAEIFFGRNKEITDGVERLRQYPFLTVVGPSGSGKSSLVHAGMIPALRKTGRFGTGGWVVKPMRPGTEPLTALAETLNTTRAALSAMSFQERTLLFVDQFEELFTLTSVPDAQQFLNILLALVSTRNLYILLTVRADFYSELMASSLWERIKANRLEVAPLGEEELRAAVLEPAAQVGVTVDEVLVERLVADAAGEAGVLPLLQETLVLLWDNVERRYLALQAYTAMADGERSGLQVAIERRADITYNSLSPEARIIARRIFLRLIQFGEGRADTRRQLPEKALRSAGDDSDLLDQTLQQLANSRLLTFSGKEEDEDRRVDISHEALITGWGKLREWVLQRRNAEQLRRRLQATAERSEELNYQGGLLDTVELREAERWLHSIESTELGVSHSLQVLVRQSRKRQRRSTIIRYVSVALVLLLIVAAGGIYVIQQNRIVIQQNQYVSQLEDANTAQNEALATIKVQATAEARQSNISLARQLAAQSLSSIKTNRDVELSLLLAVEASKAASEVGLPIQQVDEALREALISPPKRTLRHEDSVTQVTFSPHSYRLITASEDGAAHIWDSVSGEQVAVIPYKDSINKVIFSPDSSRLLTIDENGTVHIWDSASGEKLDDLSHQGSINRRIIFSPDGSHLATSQGNVVASTVHIWDSVSGEELSTLPHNPGVTSVVFSTDGSRLATTKVNGITHLWDSVSSQELAVFTGTVATISPDGSHLAITTSNGPAVDVHVWDSASGQELAVLSHAVLVRKVVFSPDGSRLATGSVDRTARIWDSASGEQHTLKHGDSVTDLIFSPDGSLLATASGDGTARIWNGVNGAELAVLRHEGQVNVVVFSPDGSQLATASNDGTARIWDSTSGDELAVLRHGGSVNDVVFSPDGSYLATASNDGTARIWRSAANDQHVLLSEEKAKAVVFGPNGFRWATVSADNILHVKDSSSEKELVRLQHVETIDLVFFSPDGSQLATTSNDNIVHFWDITSSKQLDLPHERQVLDIDFSPDGSRLATAITDDSRPPYGIDTATVYLWDTSSGQQVKVLPFKDHAWSVNDVDFSPDGSRLATASRSDAGSFGGTVRVWNSVSFEELVVHALEDYAHKVDFNPDGSRLATAGTDGTVHLFDSTNGEQLHVFTHWSGTTISVDGSRLATGYDFVYEVIFSPDGSRLASAGGDGTVRIWDITGGQELAIFRHESSVKTVVFSPDGSRLATASGFFAHVWDNTSGEKVATLRHGANVEKIAFSADGSHLATIDADGKAHILPVDMDLLVALACSTVSRGLSVQEWKQYMGPATTYHSTCLGWPVSQTYVQSVLNEGRKLAESGDLEAAIARFEEALEFNPDLNIDSEVEAKKLAAPARVAEGRSLARVGNIKAAIDHFEEALKFDPELDLDPETEANKLAAQALVATGRLLAQDGYIEGAIARFEEALEFNPDLNIDSEVEAKSQAAKALVGKARSLAREEKIEAAIAYFEEALKFDPELDLDPETETKSLAAQGLKKKGDDAWATGNYEQAIVHYSKAVVFDPNNTLYYVDRGDAYYSHGEYEQAIADYGKAIELHYEPLSRAYYNRGKSYAYQDKYEQAVADINFAIELEPEKASYYNGACWYGSLLGHAVDVLSACDEAVKLASENSVANYRDSRGLARALTGNVEGAIEDFKAFIEWSKENDQYEQNVETRETWIERLEAGEEPLQIFDEETLERLLN